MIKKLLLSIFLLVVFVGSASATVADIGNPQTIGKHNISIYNGYEYGSKFAVRYNTTSATTIDAVGFYRYMDYDIGTGGIYSAKLVYDNNGLPGSVILAENTSFTQEETLWGKQNVTLDRDVTLEAGRKYWIIFDGAQADVANHMDFGIIDTQIQPEGITGIDYQRWPLASWNGASWSTPYNRLGAYPVYGVVWVCNDGAVVGDGQFALREDTQYIYSTYSYGNKIHNAPSVAYKINSISTRLIKRGTPTAPLYFTVYNNAKSEIANVSVNASALSSTWSKTSFTFSPALEIPAGNNEIYAYFKSPEATVTNCYQTRAIEYVDQSHSYPYTDRYLISGTSYYIKSAFDEITNISISYESGTSSNNYYVSPSGNDSNSGTSSSLPWKTLTKASSFITEHSTLWLMPGTYTDTLVIPQSNINVSAFSTDANITMAHGTVNAIVATGKTNIKIDGINIIGAGDTDSTVACSIYFNGGNNNTVSNCIISDGYDGIRFAGCNDSLAQNNIIARMNQHGLHLYGQLSDNKIYARNIAIENTISNCGHNMLDLHSNISDCKLANNDIFFTDDWTGTKSNVGIFVHNGNTPRTIVENNTVHHIGRPFEIYNSNDCIIKNNTFNGIRGTSSTSRVLIGGTYASVALPKYGCDNLSFSQNTFDNISYHVVFSSSAVPVTFSNILFDKSIYNGIKTADIGVYTNASFSNIIFRDDTFTNLTASWNGNTIASGDFKIQNSSLRMYDSAGDVYSLTPDYSVLSIDDDVTDIWHGTTVDAPTAAFSATPLSGTASTIITCTDSSTGEGLSYIWDFGDGSNANTKNATHAYTSAGTYTMSLTAHNIGGDDLETKTNYITISTNSGINPTPWYYFFWKSKTRY